MENSLQNSYDALPANQLSPNTGGYIITGGVTSAAGAVSPAQPGYYTGAVYNQDEAVSLACTWPNQILAGSEPIRTPDHPAHVGLDASVITDQMTVTYLNDAPYGGPTQQLYIAPDLPGNNPPVEIVESRQVTTVRETVRESDDWMTLDLLSEQYPYEMPGADDMIDARGMYQYLSDELPATLTDPIYTPGYLHSHLGHIMRVEFLVGESLTERVGTLIGVGTDFIVLEALDNTSVMVCDLEAFKFATIIPTDAR